jgi:hypothetical protein
VIGTPAFAGFTSSVTSSATYQVPMTTTPVPAGAVIVVFAGAAGATAATGVTDTQGNTYALAASSVTSEYLQAFTATAVNGLNPAAGDTWTVTFAAANTQNKNILAVMITGCQAADIAVAASGSSASPSVTGTAAGGNEVLIACVQNANAGGTPVFPASLTVLGGLGGGLGQQDTWFVYGQATRTGSVTASAAITSAPWAVIMVSFPAAPPVAAGTGSSPSGGAQLPPYPVLPSPRTWSSRDQLLTPLLRADPGNALLLLASPPLFIGGQTVTAQSVPTAADTPVTLDTDVTDTWAAHAIPAKTIAPPLAGWYLAEGFCNLASISAGTAIAGFQAVQNAATVNIDGGRAAGTAGIDPLPNAADLIQVNPATADTIALYCAQTSGSAKTLASAWLKAEWVAASSGTVVASPVPAAGWTTGATVLLDAVAAGAVTVIVSDPSGIAAGGAVALGWGNAAQETVTVASVSGQTVVTSACAYPHPAQAPVSVPVSAAWMNQQVRDKIRFLAYRPIARLTTQGGSQSLPSQAWPAGTAITLASPAGAGLRCTDSFGGWAAGNPTRYTFPLPGTWYLYGQVYLADAASPLTVSAGLAISGGTIWWGDRTLSAGSTSESVCATVRRVVRVAAGQYAEVYGSQGSGGSLAVKTTATANSRMLCVWRGF